MVRLSLSLFVVCAFCACDRQPAEESEGPPVTEADQQVKRLRRDNEIEMNDLRGRWVAAHGLLELQRDELAKIAKGHASNDQKLRDRIAGLEASLALVLQELTGVREELEARENPKETVLDRLARSFEEIHCLRKQGADEAVSAVYARYGFPDEKAWAEAWMTASRSEEFERSVSTRVERLCP